jgi:two-component system, sensor histidine kinase
LLQTLGNTVRVVNDGSSALEEFDSFDPHVILLDIGLPGMDGYEVCKAIRRRGAESRPIIVALTGWGQAEDRKKSVEAGFDRHLVKPVSFPSLLEVVTTIDTANAS